METADNPVVTLLVSDREFKTLLRTLIDGSDYFKSTLSGRWSLLTAAHSGVDKRIFVDADPAIFEHLLHHMRHERMPLLWEDGKGFDVATYQKIYEQAMYFGVRELARWIEEKRYIPLVKVHYSTKVSCLEGYDIQNHDGALTGDTTRDLTLFERTEKAFCCPRLPYAHPRPAECDDRCMAANGGELPRFEPGRCTYALITLRKVEMMHKMHVKER